MFRVSSLALLICLVAACSRPKSDAQPREFSAATPAESPPPSPTVAETPATPPPKTALDFGADARPAVVIVSAFDQSGRLHTNGHGFFVNADGRFLVDREIMTGAVNAVAKAANGAIFNVSGSVGGNAEMILLKADSTSPVPFLEAKTTDELNVGDHIAAVLSPVERAKNLLAEAEITARFSDAIGPWFEVEPALPKNLSGAPIVNSRGELVGVASLRTPAASSCVVRSIAAVAALNSQIAPNMTASWQTFATPSPSASTTAAKSATPPKIPLRGSRLAFAPPPRYPTALRHSYYPIRGSGNFRVNFDAQGRATNVQVLRSTGNPTLDECALSSLRTWRAEPGQSWGVNVPVTFSP